MHERGQRRKNAQCDFAAQDNAVGYHGYIVAQQKHRGTTQV